jgi:hypothetical protein
LKLARKVGSHAYKPDDMKAIIIKHLPGLIDDWRRALREREACGDPPAVERQQ